MAQYKVEILNNYEKQRQMEIERVSFLYNYLKTIACKTFSLYNYGYSGIKLSKNIRKHIKIYVLNVSSNISNTHFILKSEPLLHHLSMQLNLFDEIKLIREKTPMTLVIETFHSAIQKDNMVLDNSIIKTLVQFKEFFYNDEERIVISNQDSVSRVSFTKKEIEDIENLYKLLPKPEKTTVTGIIDVMSYSKKQILLQTPKKRRVVVLLKDNSDFSTIQKYFGKSVTIEGIAHYSIGGRISYIQMEKLYHASEHDTDLFSTLSEKITVEEYIARQLKEGKKKNPLNEITGLFSDLSDEEFEQTLKILKE